MMTAPARAPSLSARRLSLALLPLFAAWLTGVAPARPEKPAPPAPDKDHAARMARGLDVFKKHVRAVLTKQ